MNLLLVEPDFPIPAKSKNHAHFLPTGLLKIGSYHKAQGDTVRLQRGLRAAPWKPDRILITSLFTYWSRHVHDAAAFYHGSYPRAKIEIGGIYASLMPEDCRQRSPFAEVTPGLYRDGVAENIALDYSLLPEQIDYQIVHASRGCPQRCAFCGTWRIEPKFTCEETILPQVQKRRIVFYDNNMLANPHIDAILRELAEHRTKKGYRLTCESQSGFDVRFLTPERAKALKAARFKRPRIAWDGRYKAWPKIRRAVRMLKHVGYGRKDIFIFMLYNFDLPYSEMRKKLDACRRWRVRVLDCRYRPIDCTEDNYRPGPKLQEPGDYHLHPNWTDRQVRRFRRAVRHQNIAILLNLPDGRYIEGCEQRKV